MTTDKDDIEPIEPGTAQELFLDHKATDCTNLTVRNHRYRLNPFVRWCGEKGIDNLNDLTGRDLQRYRLWRKEDGDLSKLTLRMQMSTLRVLLKWAGSIEAVPQNLYDKVMIPRVRPEERQRDKTLNADDAQEILEYLSKDEYASKEHAVMALLWQTGIRVGSAHSLDVDDVFLEENYVQLIHRPDEGTRAAVHHGVRQDARQHDPATHVPRDRAVLSWSRLPDCEGDESKCPEAVSPHAIRRGSIRTSSPATCPSTSSATG